MFLKQASSYPAYNGMIDAIESHLSWVFLTSEHAYKMKKPVKLPFLDLTSLAARKQSVKKELIANRVLAHGVYLGVVALTKDKENKLHLAQYTPDSAACEWLLKMKRLPHKLMLDNILKTGTCYIRRHTNWRNSIDRQSGQQLRPGLTLRASMPGLSRTIRCYQHAAMDWIRRRLMPCMATRFCACRLVQDC